MDGGYGNDEPVNKAPAKKKKGGFHGRQGKRKFTGNNQTELEQNMSSVVRELGNDASITTRKPTTVHRMLPIKEQRQILPRSYAKKVGINQLA